MINSYIDEPLIVNQIVDPIGDRFAIGQRQKVIHIHLGRCPFRLPLGPIVLELAQQFLFLAVHGNDWVPVLLKRLAGGVDVLKLRIAVRMRGVLQCFSYWRAENSHARVKSVEWWSQPPRAPFALTPLSDVPRS